MYRTCDETRRLNDTAAIRDNTVLVIPLAVYARNLISITLHHWHDSKKLDTQTQSTRSRRKKGCVIPTWELLFFGFFLGVFGDLLHNNTTRQECKEIN